MLRRLCLFAFVSMVGLTGCASVDVTKTAKGFYPATKADDIEILMTRPDRKYVELATVSTTKWNPKETAKMHNALRAKTAPLGADAVVILDSGIVPASLGRQYLWNNGVAIHYEDKPTAGSAM